MSSHNNSWTEYPKFHEFSLVTAAWESYLKIKLWKPNCIARDTIMNNMKFCKFDNTVMNNHTCRQYNISSSSSNNDAQTDPIWIQQIHYPPIIPSIQIIINHPEDKLNLHTLLLLSSPKKIILFHDLILHN